MPAAVDKSTLVYVTAGRGQDLGAGFPQARRNGFVVAFRAAGDQGAKALELRIFGQRQTLVGR